MRVPTFVMAKISAGMATPTAIAAHIIQSLAACPAKAKAFMPALPMSVPMIAGPAHLLAQPVADGELRELQGEKPTSMPTAIAHAS
jgi:hypothetical protein